MRKAATFPDLRADDYGPADDAEPRGERRAWWRLLLHRPIDKLAMLGMAAAAFAIIVNALFLQTGPHPAPIFAIKPPHAGAVTPAAENTGALVLPRSRPDQAAARPNPDTVAGIQRELARKRFYDGPSDGVYGPKTDAAIRDFEQAAGLKPSAAPNEALLHAIQASKVTGGGAASASGPRHDPIAALLVPEKRVLAVQRALTDYGYGQFKPTGFFDPATREAIEKFERAHKLPVAGQITDRLVRELSAETGRPLD